MDIKLLKFKVDCDFYNLFRMPVNLHQNLSYWKMRHKSSKIEPQAYHTSILLHEPNNFVYNFCWVLKAEKSSQKMRSRTSETTIIVLFKHLPFSLTVWIQISFIFLVFLCVSSVCLSSSQSSSSVSLPHSAYSAFYLQKYNKTTSSTFPRKSRLFPFMNHDALKIKCNRRKKKNWI